MTMPTVLSVLRSGGDFRPEHVIRLYRAIRLHWPDTFLDFVCLTDTRIGQYGIREIPLIGGWRGWWSKMELMRPDIPGTLLYFDLDCLVVGSLADIAGLGGLHLLRDFYRPRGLQAAMMLLPEAERRPVWDAWIANPGAVMKRHRSDQEYLEPIWLQTATRFQDAVPGQIVGYKTDVRGGPVPEDARVVMYHGRPRPWETELWAA